jgi:hypothetical protein
MRSKLKKMNNQTGMFKAKFNKVYINNDKCLILLEDVYANSGTYVASHVWITLDIKAKVAKFKRGDDITFVAKVFKYKRNLVGVPRSIARERLYDFSFKNVEEIYISNTCRIS